jgi:hypothetical protein
MVSLKSELTAPQRRLYRFGAVNLTAGLLAGIIGTKAYSVEQTPAKPAAVASVMIEKPYPPPLILTAPIPRATVKLNELEISRDNRLSRQKWVTLTPANSIPLPDPGKGQYILLITGNDLALQKKFIRFVPDQQAVSADRSAGKIIVDLTEENLNSLGPLYNPYTNKKAVVYVVFESGNDAYFLGKPEPRYGNPFEL